MSPVPHRWQAVIHRAEPGEPRRISFAIRTQDKQNYHIGRELPASTTDQETARLAEFGQDLLRTYSEGVAQLWKNLDVLDFRPL